MIQAWGPGLEGGMVDMPADFVVESIGADAGMLGKNNWLLNRQITVNMKWISVIYSTGNYRHLLC